MKPKYPKSGWKIWGQNDIVLRSRSHWSKKIIKSHRKSHRLSKIIAKQKIRNYRKSKGLKTW